MNEHRYDVVILGGALAGAATALLLRRRRPEWRVLVVEKNPAFDRKVGESTVEISAYFLTHILHLYDHLSREHLTKQGLRFWFHHGGVETVQEASEFGPNQLTRVGTFQLDRSVLDEHVLRLAGEAGAEIWRPAKAVEVRLAEETGEEENRIRIEKGSETLQIACPWVVDASGRTAILARKRGMLHPVPEHPISAVWARYRGVKDLDGHELTGNDPDSPYARYSIASRRLGTNHFTGWGYWIWFIPLKGGETSIGAVWDRRLVEPEGRNAEERMRWFLEGNPLTRQLTERAEPVPDDLRSFANLPYRVDRVSGRGWSLVGDSAGFLDPLYSPGIDQISFTVMWTLELLEHRLGTRDERKLESALEQHGIVQRRYFDGMLEAIYRDKYALLGDYDTMVTSALLDTAFYYFFGVFAIYLLSGRHLLRPPFWHGVSIVFVKAIRFYKNRLATIARRRLKLGTYGLRNAAHRPRFRGFTLDLGNLRMLFHGLVRWVRAEAEHAWSFIHRPHPLRGGMPAPMNPGAVRANGSEKAPAPSGAASLTGE